MSRVRQTVTIVGLLSFGLSSAHSLVAQSPPDPALPWMNTSLTPEQRADLLIPRLTLEQKVQQISNDTRPARDDDNRPPGCEFQEIGRHIEGIPELAIPTVRMVNGGTGIRGGDCLPEPRATGLPSTPASAATFNPELSRLLGEVLGDEARRHGHHVMLAPGMNLHRHPFGGRNYEYQSEDPYLSGVMAVETIKGIEAHGIHANAKHFAGNEQETHRREGESVIPPRALHELYLLPFEMAVKDAQPASIMCAFPQINGVSACSNAELLTTMLRQRWGFEGYVISDRRAVHDLASIKAGVDWELSHITPLHYSIEPQPGQRGNPGSEGIATALEAGTITVGDIDQMLRRRYVQMFKFGHFETDFDVLYEAVPDFIGHGLVAREIAEQGIVLLKNENNVLPLNAANIGSVALIGAEWFAGMAKLPPRSTTASNSNVVTPYTVTPQNGLENVLRSLGSAATVTYNSAGGTGTQEDRDAAVELAMESDVVIVMVGDNPHELCDRETLGLPIIPPADPGFCGYDELGEGEYDLPSPDRGTGTHQENLMRELIAAPGVPQKMVVVLKTEGMVLMPWLDQVPALLEAWYPGQEDGNAVANILFGVRNPSGKLPMTFGTSEREAAHATEAQFPGLWAEAPPWLEDPRFSAQYTEGLQVGYRWYEANGVTPVFPFGFGLSYTTFGYSGLSVTPTVNAQTGQPVLTVSYTIANTGRRQGAEASQVYVTLPPAAGQPAKRLVGFQKVDLMPGTSQQVTVTIDASASNHPLSYWVPENDAPVPGWSNGSWSTAPGNYTVHVGTSSADTPLEATVAGLGPPAPVGLLPPSGLYVSEMQGNRVTFRWTAPLGLTPTGFIVEGGVTPGSVEQTIVTGPTPILTFDAPTGAFFVRVRTQSGAEISGPSNEIPVFVQIPVVPSAPENLAALVNGTTVTLAWRNSFAGGEPTSLVLDVTGSVTGSVPLALTDTVTSTVPAGTYTIALRALNGAGSSVPSNPVSVTVPDACSDAPLTPTNFLVHNVGSTMFAIWEPPATGAAPTAYALNVSGSFVGSFSTAGLQLSQTVGPGSYTVNVVATNPCGTSAATASQTVTIP